MLNEIKQYKHALEASALALLIFSSNLNSSHVSSMLNKFYANSKSDVKIKTEQTAPVSNNYTFPSVLYPADFKILSLASIVNQEAIQKTQDSLKTLDKMMIENRYSPMYITSIANFKKSPEETAFDKALDNVLKTKSLDSTLLDPYMIKASAWQESRFDSTVVSDKKAAGYLQLLKGTYLHFRPGDKFPKDAFKPENNISAGIDYYSYLINYIKNHHPRADTLSNNQLVEYAIVAYNSGPGAFTHANTKNGRKMKPKNQQWLIEFMPKESRDHLMYITAKMQELKERDELVKYAKLYTKETEKREQNMLALNSLKSQVYHRN